MYLNFGDLGEKVKELVDEYQAKSHSTQKLESLGLNFGRIFIN